MKKNLHASVFVLGMLAFTCAEAQTNAIKISILAPIVKTFNVQYEKAFDSKSFQLGFFYTGFSESTTKFKGIGVTPELRFYLSETPAPEGIYVAPFLRYQNFSIENTDPFYPGKGTFSAFGGGVIIGKQWIFKKKVVLDMFLGPSYNSGKTKVESGSNFDTGTFDGFGLRAGISFGFVF